ncbi:hypothetical protein TcasGA2_TC005607 [Tribolium castaneum]|uniref:Uncharacterized protein n=1 Tax=Tribolium castaneum TaxID=7070 RepID=D6WX93_TRICA|nr:hypothetical protein TcasGA2_TC005607 [Tribolium castaneum]
MTAGEIVPSPDIRPMRAYLSDAHVSRLDSANKDEASSHLQAIYNTFTLIIIVFCVRGLMKRHTERTMTDADEIEDIGGWSRAVSLLHRCSPGIQNRCYLKMMASFPALPEGFEWHVTAFEAIKRAARCWLMPNF